MTTQSKINDLLLDITLLELFGMVAEFGNRHPEAGTFSMVVILPQEDNRYQVDHYGNFMSRDSSLMVILQTIMSVTNIAQSNNDKFVEDQLADLAEQFCQIFNLGSIEAAENFSNITLMDKKGN